MNGTVGILNVGAGDVKLTFDKNNPQETIRAARIVKDLLRRGYALLVEFEEGGVKKHRRARDFDENTCEYIIADFDPVTAAEADKAEAASKGQTDGEEGSAAQGAPAETTAETRPTAKARRFGTTRRITAEKARGTAVARTAGG